MLLIIFDESFDISIAISIWYKEPAEKVYFQLTSKPFAVRYPRLLYGARCFDNLWILRLADDIRNDFVFDTRLLGICYISDLLASQIRKRVVMCFTKMSRTLAFEE